MKKLFGKEQYCGVPRGSDSVLWSEKLGSKDTRRQVQGDALLRNQAQCQQLLDRKVSKRNSVMRLKERLGKVTSRH